MNRWLAWLGDVVSGRILINHRLEDMDELRSAAALAYKRCVEWFGEPGDSDWTLDIVEGPTCALSRPRHQNRYVIVIWRQLRYAPQRVGTVAHEVYHRVTLLREGLRREVWVDEMIAGLVAQKLLDEIGHGGYARHRLMLSSSRETPLDMRRIQATGQKSFLLGLRSRVYPAWFGDDVLALGTRLEALVGWDAICRLVDCVTWEEWLKGLPCETAALATDLLRVPSRSSHRRIPPVCPRRSER